MKISSINKIDRRKFISDLMKISAGGLLFSVACQTQTESNWQFGCYTRPWGEFDYRVALDGIAEAGFKFAGLMTAKGGLVINSDTSPEEAEKIGQEAKSRDLQIISLYGGNFDVTKSISDGINELKRLIDNAYSCDSSSLMIGGITDPELEDDYYKVISECCDYAAEKGITLDLKPHGGTNSTGPECRQLIKKVNHDSFNLWYDPGNIYWYSNGELDPVDDVVEVDGLVTGFCVKDFRMPKDVNLTPGTGMVDFDRVFTRLKQGGFTKGPLIVETLSLGDLNYINNEAIKAYKFLEELTR